VCALRGVPQHRHIEGVCAACNGAEREERKRKETNDLIVLICH
jgi:hypothetical protein